MGTGLSINSEMEPPQAQGKNRGSRIENNVVNSNLEGFFTEHGLKQARKKGREKQLVKICFKSLRGSCCFKILPLCLTSFSTIFINLIFFCPLLLLHSVKKKKKNSTTSSNVPQSSLLSPWGQFHLPICKWACLGHQTTAFSAKFPSVGGPAPPAPPS